jgi:hypothetical protein
LFASGAYVSQPPRERVMSVACAEGYP